MGFLLNLFGRTKEDIPKPVSNQEIALDLLTAIRHKSTESQREIVYTLVRHVFDGCHIHANPQRKNITGGSN